MTPLLVALGGGAGAAIRYLVDTAVTRRAARLPGVTVPVGTLVVNTTACFLIGLLTAWTARLGAPVAAVAGVGFLGGYSTFSTASVEAARLALAGRSPAALAHAAVIAVAGLLAGALGLLLGPG